MGDPGRRGRPALTAVNLTRVPARVVKETLCMASFSHAVGAQTYRFDSFKDVMAKASPARSGDFLRRRRRAERRRAGAVRKWPWPISR